MTHLAELLEVQPLLLSVEGRQWRWGADADGRGVGYGDGGDERRWAKGKAHTWIDSF